MQIDMHFNGTYAIARAAGLSPDVALTIATSAQFVDDAVETDAVLKDKGAFFVPVASCHNMEDKMNLHKVDQWHVWLPYHFLPANKGRFVGERLICRAGDEKNESANAIIRLALKHAREPFGKHLMGVVTHVLQDTYSHDGFIGLSSDYNCVKMGSIRIESMENQALRDDKRSVINKIVTDLLEAPGHAAVGCLPDYPYLAWGFQYMHGAVQCPRTLSDVYFKRDNKVVFEASCRRLHQVFVAFGQALYGDAYGGPTMEYDQIKGTVEGIVALEAHRAKRGNAWKTALEAEKFCETHVDDIGVVYDANVWRGDVHEGENVYPGSDAVLFMQASHRYRAFILSELLPSLLPR